MGLLDRFRKRPEADLSLEQILERAGAGDTQGALVAATDKLRGVGRRLGTSSPGYAAALFEHATVCVTLGMIARATESMRAASEIRGPAPEDEKHRLTYLMNLGEALACSEKLDEALTVAERGLAERELFYGKEHPGYAYGLESLADVALALGRYDEALGQARQALAIYDACNHERVPHAWARVFLAAGGSGSSWKQLEMSGAMANAVLDELSARRVPIAAQPQLRAVEVLAPLAADRDSVLRAFIAVQDRALSTRDPASRAAALRRVIDLADAQGNGALVLDAELGLAFGHDEAGDHEAADRAYGLAERRARALGSPELLSKGLRNAGLYFMARAPDRGLALLREAADLSGAPPEELARSRMALGIQVQHRGALAEARALLAAGLAAVDGGDPDAICARSHLRAIEEQGSCGCGSPHDVLTAQIERVVRDRLPPGLLAGIDLEEGNVSIRAARALSDDEARLVADTVDLALTEARARLART